MTPVLNLIYIYNSFISVTNVQKYVYKYIFLLFTPSPMGSIVIYMYIKCGLVLIGCGKGSGDSGCGTLHTFTSDCGTIDVKQGPGAATCEWLIEVPLGHVINITFVHFDIEYTGKYASCVDQQPLLPYMSVTIDYELTISECHLAEISLLS